MRPYRKTRTITGQVIYVKETREEALNRWLLVAETIATPLVMIWVFAKAAGMI